MNKKKKLYLLSFFIPMILMTIVFYYLKIFPFGDKSLMAIDFNQQFIDLYIYMKNTFLKGDFGGFFYSFTKSIGGNMTGIWSYYLNSPLNIFYILIPLSKINYANLITILLRYGLSGLTFTYFLIKRHKGDEKNSLFILTCSTAYALNGFAVSYQVVPILYDALWLLPLVLVALEKVLDGEKSSSYILLLALTIFIQFYTGFMICIFIVLYSIYYLSSKDNFNNFSEWIKGIWKPLSRVALSSILSVGLISFMFFPNLKNLISSKGTSFSPLKFSLKFQINPLDILSKLFIGAFDQSSWPAGPNLPNIYVGSLMLMGLVIYFTRKNIKLREKIGAFGILFIFFISVSIEFFSKLWHMGQNPAGFFYRFSWIICFFIILLAYKGLKDVGALRGEAIFFAAGIVLLITNIVKLGDHSYITPDKIIITLAFLIAILVLLYMDDSRSKWLLLAVITISELTANAALTQKTYNYNGAYRFNNAVSSIGEAIDLIRPGKEEFYRISKSFTRSKNDPMTLNYPGLTHFSSNIEKGLRDFMDNLGNNSVDATNFYMGTPLTDALFSIRYYVTNKNYKPLTHKEADALYVFTEDVSRSDLLKDGKVNETKRFEIYEIKDYLPIAFAVNDSVKNLKFTEDKPAENQQKLAEAIGEEGKAYFTEVAPKTIELKDVEEQSKDSMVIKSAPGMVAKVIYYFEPDSDDYYLIEVPKNLSDYLNEVSILLNQVPFRYRKKFTANQLFMIGDNLKGNTQKLEININRDNFTNLSELKIYKLNKEALKNLIDRGKEGGLKVLAWGSNFVKGEVNVPANKPFLLTSIMFDPGWKITVDGNNVEPIQVADSLMGIPVTEGKHEITMRYLPPGLNTGILLSLISVLIFIWLFHKNRISFIGRKSESNKKLLADKDIKVKNRI